MSMRQRIIRALLICFLFHSAWAAPVGFKIIGPDNAAINNAKKRIQNLALHFQQQKEKSLSEIIYRMEIAIEKALQPYGYFSPKVTTKQRSSPSPQVHFTIDLGKPVYVTQAQLSIEGAGKFLPRFTLLQQQFPLKSGMQLNTETYRHAKDILSQEAAKAGYINHDFTSEKLVINTESRQAFVNLVFNTGPLYTFGATQFSQTPLSEVLLNRYIHYQQGEPFSNQKLSKLQEILGKSGYFNHVVVSPQLPKTLLTTTQIISPEQQEQNLNTAYTIASLLQNQSIQFALDLQSKEFLTHGQIPYDQPLQVFPIDQDHHFDLNIIQSILQSIHTIQDKHPELRLIVLGKNEPGTSLASLTIYPWFENEIDITPTYDKQTTHWLNLTHSNMQSNTSSQTSKQNNFFAPSDSAIPIRVILEPKKKYAHKVSFGYGTNNGLRASFQSEYPIINQNGHKLSTGITLAKKLAFSELNQHDIQIDTDYPLEATLEAKYSLPGFNPSQESFVLDSSLNRTSFYTREGRKPAKNAVITARYVNSKASWNHSTNMTYLHETSKILNQGAFDILSPSALWTYQKSDNIVRPTQGFLASLQLRGATNLNDNKHNFLSVRSAWRQLTPITNNSRAFIRLDLGYLSLYDQQFVPKTYQLLSGGSTAMRGYDYMSVGPGKLLATLSTDLQYQIASSWWLGGFFDGGNVYSDWKAIKSPSQIKDYTKKSHGITLTNQTPIGALTITYARAKRYQQRWKWQPKWHVSIGSEI